MKPYPLGFDAIIRFTIHTIYQMLLVLTIRQYLIEINMMIAQPSFEMTGSETVQTSVFRVTWLS